ncbi:hypothetical protein C8J55DRAFT_487692 [Lentinula edodes]|uniref:Uncharacterized protein n=1 Tax=Lentinula lateritia TaxID=40482 RepID=A0A9W9ARF1_9AGAR|nr:hypothetical protein C8J55DRAFT_487692 [Lentinula edodes]
MSLHASATSSANLVKGFAELKELRDSIIQMQHQWHETVEIMNALFRQAEELDEQLSCLERISREFTLCSGFLHSQLERLVIIQRREELRGKETNALIDAGIQAEVFRLLEMKIMLPDDLLQLDMIQLNNLEEFLSGPQNIESYGLLQKTTARILEEVCKHLLSSEEEANLMLGHFILIPVCTTEFFSLNTTMDALKTRDCDEVASGWVEIVNNTDLERGDSDDMNLQSQSLVERQEGLIQIANHLIQNLRRKLKELAILNAQLREENAVLCRKIAASTTIQD